MLFRSSSTLHEIKTGIQGSDLVIDFGTIDGQTILRKACDSSQPKCMVICTTGLNKQDQDYWKGQSRDSKSPILLAPNTSLGILLMLKSALSIAGICLNNNFDIEIEECHHRHKKDSPSGTTLFLAESLQEKNPHLTYKRTEQG